jgi:NAD(P)H-hydrate repair Nnr-like enzyme with NAD(P)H-hydrate dehydratase domain
MLAPPEDITRAAGARCDALVVGPGLGRGADDEVRALWATEARACVFDADALRAIAPLATLAPAAGPRLLTPHAGEAAALLGASRERVTRDRLAAAAALGAVAATVLKGPCPVVAGDGPARVHPGWLPQLGTAGSGDVLAGVCGALLARSPRALPRAEVVERASRAVAMHLHAARSLHVGAGAGDVARALRP